MTFDSHHSGDRKTRAVLVSVQLQGVSDERSRKRNKAFQLK